MAQESLIIRQAQWTDAHARLLAAAMRADPLVTVETLRAAVANGAASLIEVIDSADQMVCAAVLRVECRELGNEGVIVAAAGALPGGRLLPVVLPVLENSFRGVNSIRVHTARPGLVRALARHGYAPREVILSKMIGVH